jgi:nonspecific dipeptidase
MVDLVWIMNKLVDEEGNILVEGIMDSVAPVTPEEEAKYHNIGRKNPLTSASSFQRLS